MYCVKAWAWSAQSLDVVQDCVVPVRYIWMVSLSEAA
jgi:hypothetical protein